MLKILNFIHISIQFTMKVIENWLLSLSALKNMEDDKIWMNINSKSTDFKEYVPYNSNYPKHCKKYPFWSCQKNMY